MSSEKPMNNERWWEFYFVRYFVGTVFGMALVLFLNFDTASPLCGKIIPNLTDISKLDFSYSLVLGAIGLAFCYMSSAPILVFHALRGNFKPILAGDYKILGVGCLLCTVIIILFVTSYLSFNLLFSDSASILNILSIISFNMIFGFQVFLYLYSALTKNKNVLDYYITLSKERAERKKENKMIEEYVESYKHLREHGNAFFILFMEVNFALILYVLQDPIHTLIFVLLWIVPACLVWFVGTYLENSLLTLDKNA